MAYQSVITDAIEGGYAFNLEAGRLPAFETDIARRCGALRRPYKKRWLVEEKDYELLQQRERISPSFPSGGCSQKLQEWYSRKGRSVWPCCNPFNWRSRVCNSGGLKGYSRLAYAFRRGICVSPKGHGVKFPYGSAARISRAAGPIKQGGCPC